MTAGTLDQSGSCLEIARRADPDRFLTALFAPPRHRPALCVLIAFNHELVRAVEMPSARSGAGPIATLIRLQWWREVVQDSRADWRNHEVAEPLHGLVASGAVPAATLLRMIDAREAEAEGFETIADWRGSLLGGAGGLQQAIGEVLGVEAVLGGRLAAVGAAYAVGALIRHLPAMIGSGHLRLPEELVEAAGPAAVPGVPGAQMVEALHPALLREGGILRNEAGRFRLPRERLAAVLPLVLARRDLSRAPDLPVAGRGFGDRLAVLGTYMIGRV
ncbi:squalene/phytoene synthase family protein [Lichenicola sp.]|uniref:squalene/phytoene synthase family protein n=1 Tax=Lichenicola sp. TaxID=2804529 RepID=UPI003AFF8963